MKLRLVLLSTLFLGLFSSASFSADRKILIVNAASTLGIACAQEISLTSDLLLTTKAPGALSESLKTQHVDQADVLYLDCTKSPDQLFKTSLEKQELDGIVLLVAKPNLGDHFLPSAEAWEEAFQESFVGPLEALRAALPVLKKGGRVVIVPQSVVQTAGPETGHNTTLNLMWLAQANKIADALRQHNVRVHTVSKRTFKDGNVSVHNVARLVRGYLENHVARYEHKKPLVVPDPSRQIAR